MAEHQDLTMLKTTLKVEEHKLTWHTAVVRILVVMRQESTSLAVSMSVTCCKSNIHSLERLLYISGESEPPCRGRMAAVSRFSFH